MKKKLFMEFFSVFSFRFLRRRRPPFQCSPRFLDLSRLRISSFSFFVFSRRLQVFTRLPRSFSFGHVFCPPLYPTLFYPIYCPSRLDSTRLDPTPLSMLNCTYVPCSSPPPTTTNANSFWNFPSLFYLAQLYIHTPRTHCTLLNLTLLHRPARIYVLFSRI